MSHATNPAEGGALEVRIHALERSLYIVELFDGAASRWVRADDGARAMFRNLGAARAAVAGLGAVPIRLIHRSAYDEMVGLGPAAANGIDIALASADD